MAIRSLLAIVCRFFSISAYEPGDQGGIHTNGGVRSEDFWRALGRVLPKGKGYVRFGIDGLENTIHVYRRNVRWQILMRNVKAFVAAGGNAEWDYIVFRHNEHQVEQARALARKIHEELAGADQAFDIG